MTLQEEN